LRTYRLNFGSAQRIAKILNDIFISKSSGDADSASSQITPGASTSQSRLDSLGSGTPGGNGGGGAGAAPAAPAGGGQTGVSTGLSTSGSSTISAAFDQFSDRKGSESKTAEISRTTTSSKGGSSGALFENVRIGADDTNNSIVVYSNLDEFRAIERALHSLDRPQLQVAIEATVAEVTLTDQLQYGVQSFLTSSDVGLHADNGSVGLLPAGAASATAASSAAASSGLQQAIQSAFLQRVLPGFNLLLGSEAQPRFILSALSAITTVKVLSSPSLVVMDNQPALLEVGDQIPVTTSSATLLTNSSTPVVNTIEMLSTGVILKILPRIHANGAITLEIDQNISNVVNPNVQTLTPTISQRRIHSTVGLTSGQTVLLGGLISEETDRSKSGIPWINNIQYLGDLLGNTAKSRQRSEIIVFVKPQVIGNTVDAQAVTEEFRQRLDSMRPTNPVIEQSVPAPVSSASARRK
jgi:general secretion pathway protein D